MIGTTAAVSDRTTVCRLRYAHREWTSVVTMGIKEAALGAVAIKANQDPLTNNKETNVACKFAIQKNSDIVKRHKCVHLCF